MNRPGNESSCICVVLCVSLCFGTRTGSEATCHIIYILCCRLDILFFHLKSTFLHSFGIVALGIIPFLTGMTTVLVVGCVSQSAISGCHTVDWFSLGLLVVFQAFGLSF